MSRPGPTTWLALVAGLAFLYVPMAVVIVYAFNDSRLVTMWSHFSLRWFVAALADDTLVDAARLSLAVAVGSASFATVIGTMAALRSAGPSRRRRAATTDILFLTPIALPDVMIGFGLLLLFVVSGALLGFPRERGVLTLFVAHVALGAPYAYVVIRSRLARHDWTLEDAASDLGAGPIRRLWAVTVPMLAPALLSAWLAAFVVSFDDVVIASFVSGPGGSTLPMVIFSSVRLGLSPEANAVAAMLLAFVLLAGAAGIAALTVLDRRRRGAPGVAGATGRGASPFGVPAAD